MHGNKGIESLYLLVIKSFTWSSELSALWLVFTCVGEWQIKL